MSDPTRLLSSPVLRLIAAVFPLKLTRTVARRKLAPLVLTAKRLGALRLRAATAMSKALTLSDDAARRLAGSYTGHFSLKFADDCVIMALGLRRTLRFLDSTVSVEGVENLAAALESGRGVLAVGSHVGSITVGTIGLLNALRPGLYRSCKGIAICMDPMTRRFPGVAERFRQVQYLYPVPITLIQAGAGESNVARAMTDALRAGWLVTTNLDVMAPSAHESTFQLFGTLRVRLPSLTGAVRAALLTGATVLPWTNRYDRRGRLIVTVEPRESPWPADLTGSDDYPRLAEGCEFLRGRLEAWVRATPEQWLYWDRIGERVER